MEPRINDINPNLRSLHPDLQDPIGDFVYDRDESPSQSLPRPLQPVFRQPQFQAEPQTEQVQQASRAINSQSIKIKLEINISIGKVEVE